MLTKFEDSDQKLTPHKEIKRLIRILKSPVTSPDVIIYADMITVEIQ